jgi:hypothetical protein
MAAASCAHPAFVLPPGPPVSAPDGAAIWAAASARCRAVTTYSAELHVSGRVGDGPKLKATVLAGLTATDDIRLEVPAPFGRPVFILAGTNGTATLVTRDDHLLSTSSQKIIEAIVGLPFGPKAFLSLLTACAPDPAVAGAARYGDVLMVRTGTSRAYLRQTAAAWRVVALDVEGLRVEYGAGADAWPTEVRVSSTEGRTPVVDVAMSASQIDVDGAIPATAFRVTPPAHPLPLTLEELRAAGPLGVKR